MSGELANKINKLCGRLNRKYYLHAIADISEDTQILPDTPVPYNKIILSSGISLNPTTNEIVIKVSGIYELSFAVFPTPRITIMNFGLMVAKNGMLLPETATSSYLDIPTGMALATTLRNNILLDLNEGDKITIVNISRTGGGTPIPFDITTSYLSNPTVTNITIKRL